MQENQLPQTQVNQLVTDSVPTVTTVSTNDQQPKSNGFLVILLSILLITSLAIAGFFAFQTQRLNEELIMKNEELKQTTQNTIEPTTEPVATSSSMTIDPTANWDVFTDEISKFTFKHPSKYKITTIVKDSGDGFSYLLSPDNLITITLFTKYTNGQSEFYMDSPKTGDITIGQNIWKTYFLPQGYLDGAVGAGKPIYGVQTEIDKRLFSVTLFDQKDITTEQKQILSTFKFSN